MISEIKDNPEFIKLEEEYKKLSTRMTEIFEEIERKWPPQEGFIWGGSINNTINLFVIHSDNN